MREHKKRVSDLMVIAKAEPCKYEINNELVYQTNLHTQNCLPLYLIDCIIESSHLSKWVLCTQDKTIQTQGIKRKQNKTQESRTLRTPHKTGSVT